MSILLCIFRCSIVLNLFLSGGRWPSGYGVEGHPVGRRVILSNSNILFYGIEPPQSVLRRL